MNVSPEQNCFFYGLGDLEWGAITGRREKIAWWGGGGDCSLRPWEAGWPKKPGGRQANRGLPVANSLGWVQHTHAGVFACALAGGKSVWAPGHGGGVCETVCLCVCSGVSLGFRVHCNALSMCVLFCCKWTCLASAGMSLHVHHWVVFCAFKRKLAAGQLCRKEGQTLLELRAGNLGRRNAGAEMSLNPFQAFSAKGGRTYFCPNYESPDYGEVWATPS